VPTLKTHIPNTISSSLLVALSCIVGKTWLYVSSVKTMLACPGKTVLADETECLADSGYQRLAGLHAKRQTPFKKPKGGQLTDEQKQFNKTLAVRRVMIEHIIRHLKIFRIVSSKYRNRRRRFMLRMNLIAGLYSDVLNH